MPQGLLEVTGTIDLAQFWPAGQSDADTVKVLLAGAGPFRFRAHPGAPFKVTHAFDGATVKGKATKPTIDTQNRITIRLQGIDAPELHYRPTAPTLDGKKPTPSKRAAFNANNANFRQFFGETATVQTTNSSPQPAGVPSSAWCARRSTSQRRLRYVWTSRGRYLRHDPRQRAERQPMALRERMGVSDVLLFDDQSGDQRSHLAEREGAQEQEGDVGEGDVRRVAIRSQPDLPQSRNARSAERQRTCLPAEIIPAAVDVWCDGRGENGRRLVQGVSAARA